MKKRFNFDDFDQQLEQRAHEQYNTKDLKSVPGGSFNRYFELQEGTQLWSPDAGQHIIDIIPFIVGDKHPIQNFHGKAHYLLDVWVHQKVGVSKKEMVCLKQYGERCYLCEQNQKLWDKWNETQSDDIKRLAKEKKAKRRTMYNVVVLDTPETESKGIQIFEIAHFFLEKELNDRSIAPKGGGHISFHSPKAGKSIAFNLKLTDSGQGFKKHEYTGIQFVDRDPLSMELLEQAYSLDEFLKYASYEEQKEVFHEHEGEIPEDDDYGQDSNDQDQIDYAPSISSHSMNADPGDENKIKERVSRRRNMVNQITQDDDDDVSY